MRDDTRGQLATAVAHRILTSRMTLLPLVGGLATMMVSWGFFDSAEAGLFGGFVAALIGAVKLGHDFTIGKSKIAAQVKKDWDEEARQERESKLNDLETGLRTHVSEEAAQLAVYLRRVDTELGEVDIDEGGMDVEKFVSKQTDAMSVVESALDDLNRLLKDHSREAVPGIAKAVSRGAHKQIETIRGKCQNVEKRIRELKGLAPLEEEPDPDQKRRQPRQQSTRS